MMLWPVTATFFLLATFSSSVSSERTQVSRLANFRNLNEKLNRRLLKQRRVDEERQRDYTLSSESAEFGLKTEDLVPERYLDSSNSKSKIIGLLAKGVEDRKRLDSNKDTEKFDRSSSNIKEHRVRAPGKFSRPVKASLSSVEPDEINVARESDQESNDAKLDKSETSDASEVRVTDFESEGIPAENFQLTEKDNEHTYDPKDTDTIQSVPHSSASKYQVPNLYEQPEENNQPKIILESISNPSSQDVTTPKENSVSNNVNPRTTRRDDAESSVNQNTKEEETEDKAESEPNKEYSHPEQRTILTPNKEDLSHDNLADSVQNDEPSEQLEHNSFNAPEQLIGFRNDPYQLSENNMNNKQSNPEEREEQDNIFNVLGADEPHNIDSTVVKPNQEAKTEGKLFQIPEKQVDNKQYSLSEKQFKRMNNYVPQKRFENTELDEENIPSVPEQEDEFKAKEEPPLEAYHQRELIHPEQRQTEEYRDLNQGYNEPADHISPNLFPEYSSPEIQFGKKIISENRESHSNSGIDQDIPERKQGNRPVNKHNRRRQQFKHIPNNVPNPREQSPGYSNENHLNSQQSGNFHPQRYQSFEPQFEIEKFNIHNSDQYGSQGGDHETHNTNSEFYQNEGFAHENSQYQNAANNDHIIPESPYQNIHQEESFGAPHQTEPSYPEEIHQQENGFNDNHNLQSEYPQPVFPDIPEHQHEINSANTYNEAPHQQPDTNPHQEHNIPPPSFEHGPKLGHNVPLANEPLLNKEQNNHIQPSPEVNFNSNGDVSSISSYHDTEPPNSNFFPNPPSINPHESFAPHLPINPHESFDYPPPSNPHESFDHPPPSNPHESFAPPAPVNPHESFPHPPPINPHKSFPHPPPSKPHESFLHPPPSNPHESFPPPPHTNPHESFAQNIGNNENNFNPHAQQDNGDVNFGEHPASFEAIDNSRFIEPSTHQNPHERPLTSYSEYEGPVEPSGFEHQPIQESHKPEFIHQSQNNQFKNEQENKFNFIPPHSEPQIFNQPHEPVFPDNQIHFKPHDQPSIPQQNEYHELNANSQNGNYKTPNENERYVDKERFQSIEPPSKHSGQRYEPPTASKGNGIYKNTATATIQFRLNAPLNDGKHLNRY